MRAEEGPCCSDPSHTGAGARAPPAQASREGRRIPVVMEGPNRSRLRVGSIVYCHVTPGK